MGGAGQSPPAQVKTLGAKHFNTPRGSEPDDRQEKPSRGDRVRAVRHGRGGTIPPRPGQDPRRQALQHPPRVRARRPTGEAVAGRPGARGAPWEGRDNPPPPRSRPSAPSTSTPPAGPSPTTDRRSRRGSTGCARCAMGGAGQSPPAQVKTLGAKHFNTPRGSEPDDRQEKPSRVDRVRAVRHGRGRTI